MGYSPQPLLPFEASLPEVSRYDRVRVVAEDPRARFLPTTHLEKNMAFTLLDYIGNLAYPGGVYSQLHEIEQRQRKVYTGEPHHKSHGEGRLLARMAVSSVLHEMGDFLGSARTSYRDIFALGKHVGDTDNPRLTLQEVANESAETGSPLRPAVLVRYIELARIAKSPGESEPEGFDLLRTIENRTLTRTVERSKSNKVVRDIFMEDAENIADHVTAVAGSLTVRQCRQLCLDALSDQQRRGEFWSGMLLGMRGSYKTEAREIARAATNYQTKTAAV